MNSSYLVEALATLYRFGPDEKIIFRGGLSAYKVGALMGARIAELYDRPGFQYHSLWRVIQGDRLFTKQQLAVFCEVLGLTTRERQHLREALSKDILSRYDLDLDICLSCDDTISRYADAPVKIHQSRMESTPERVLDWANIVESQLKECSLKDLPPTTSFAISSLLARVLYATSTVYRGFTPSTHVVQVHRPYVNEIRRLASQTGERELSDLADVALGVAYYIGRQYEESISQLRNVANPAMMHDRLSLWRVRLLDYAELSGTKGFNEAKVKLMELVDQCTSLADKAFGLEALAKGLALAGAPEALDIREELGEIYAQMELANSIGPFLRVQGARTDLLITQRFGVTDKKQLERDKDRGLLLARTLAYYRYALEMDAIMREIYS